MILYLVRHGIAVDPNDPKSPPEPERPLTAKGVQKTRAAALPTVCVPTFAGLRLRTQSRWTTLFSLGAHALVCGLLLLDRKSVV